ncbi:SDR family NAD(P)-dependent oxidoreductase [Aestuariivirga sp.]|uniref:SDR family NAD(P)-dependent oxidoreductase n=1 Tax=Aestuariivirga sp. TaxID=2650926 RepID=UPI0039E3D630
MTDWTERFALKGKRALVTGASKGIGHEACRVLAEAGADIAATARDAEGLAEVKATVEALGRRCVVIEADLTTVEGAEKAARESLAAFGTVDILVNNAGTAYVAPLTEHSIAEWDRIMAVNLRAPFIIARLLAPAMIAQKSGKIVNVSSQAGVIGTADHGAYCASKGGLNMLTKVMTVEWAPHNIQTNAVCPNVILTPMGEKVWGEPEKGDPQRAKTPLNRFGKPVEVADMILYLASPASDFVCGGIFMIDGGFTAV